ncbi:MAG: class II aldolase/adducin family protein [Euryarchaeota archaeon]|nr:class II aldolase/adducin family protein [Euryarchaeota archaeon]
MAEVYVGRRFRTVFEERTPVAHPDVPALVACGRRFAARGLAEENAGYLAVRTERGMLIKAGGVSLAALSQATFAEVMAFDVERFEARVRGAMEPSSETAMAWGLFHEHPDAGAIVHIHAPAPPDPDRLPAGVVATAHEDLYGTREMARSALDAFAPGVHTVWLRDHGYVTLAVTLEAAEARFLAVLAALHPDRAEVWS